MKILRFCTILGLFFLGATVGHARETAEQYESKYKDPSRSPLGCKNLGYRFNLNTVELNPQLGRDQLNAEQEEGEAIDPASQSLIDNLSLNENGKFESTLGQNLYFIYTRSSQPLRLNQMLGESSSRDTFMNHTIMPYQWSVLATNQAQMNFICSVYNNPMLYGYGKVVDCSDSLKICEYARVKFGMNNKGNYWLVNGTTRGSAVGNVVRYGIIPR